MVQKLGHVITTCSHYGLNSVLLSKAAYDFPNPKITVFSLEMLQTLT